MKIFPKNKHQLRTPVFRTPFQRIKKLGQNCFMAKTDIKPAFRILPISPSDYHLLGFSWEGYYYYNKDVPFGASSSCHLFEAISTALEWIAINKLDCVAVVHILDVFLFCFVLFFVVFFVHQCNGG